MANQDFFTNLPPKDKDELQKTVDELVQNQYQEKFQFNAGEFDAAIAFLDDANRRTCLPRPEPLGDPLPACARVFPRVGFD